MEPDRQAASGVVEGSPKRDSGHRLMGPGLYHIVPITRFNEQDDQQLIQREILDTVEITNSLYGAWALRTKVTSRRLYPLMLMLSPHQGRHGSYIS